MSLIACTLCGKPYPPIGTPFRCECGGIYDYAEFPAYDATNIDPHERSLWKYRAMLGLSMDDEPVTLGEGSTPLVELEYGSDKIHLKLEYQNPTASYKDRGTAVLTSFLRSRGVQAAVEDSSGNAGASFAAYAARAGLQAKVFVPESASGPKRIQIEAYGAELVRIPGPRAKAAEAVLAEANQGAAYASHAFMPFGLTGIATIAYEISEQMNEMPGTIAAPVGHGGLLYGIMQGFQALTTANKIEHEPYYLGVQSAACEPVASAFRDESDTVEAIVAGETIAEGVKVSEPARGNAILAHLRATRGKIVDVDEGRLVRAYHDIARLGFFVEPTSALVYAAMESEWSNLPKPVVLILTGSGAKTNSI